MKRIGITGGIGAGKTAVTEYLRGLGYKVIDADELSHEATAKGAPALDLIHEQFGSGVFCADGSLDRKALAAVVFSDSERLAALNSIVHADVRGRMEEAANGSEIVFFSIPLLFETGAEKRMDEVWLLTASDDIRVGRACRRDGSSPDEVRARMENQMPESEKCELADVVIDNNGSLDELHAKVNELLRARLGKH